MERVLTTLLLSAAAASAVAWLVALMRERGIRPVRCLAALVKALPKAGASSRGICHRLDRRRREARRRAQRRRTGRA